MAFLITTDDTNVEVGKDVEILFTGIYPYPNEMKVFVNGVQKTNGISYNYTSQGMVRSFTISFSESGTYDVYVIYNDTILLQHSNTLTFTTKDNKINIILNHKEVQSIQLTDGGVIYQRPIFKQIGSFTVSSSKDIISFADNESSTITATVLDNNDNPISNEFILFEVDGEYIDTFTDENGEASIIYEAKGWGDVEITANCRGVSETYTIEDCLRFNALTSDDGLFTSNSAVISYSSDGMYVSNGNWSQFNLIDALHQNCSLEFDMNQISGSFYNFYSNQSGGTASTHSTERILASTGHYKITLDNGVLNYYKNNTRLYTETWTETTSYWWLWTGGTIGSFTLKNLKIKPL